ncbi:hypothetical protein V8G54_014174 [Vigna mungo]|uniref:Uncharacterized protein n=1 Tax=Vigna mungo TaxID=3915 RepID=A0AAQ3NG71_VIGMU
MDEVQVLQTHVMAVFGNNCPYIPSSFFDSNYDSSRAFICLTRLVFKVDIGPPTDKLLKASSKPHITPHPCAHYNNDNRVVRPSQKSSTSTSTNATISPMED